MAVVKMYHAEVLALSTQKDLILSAISRTQCLEVKTVENEFLDTRAESDAIAALGGWRTRAEKAMESILHWKTELASFAKTEQKLKEDNGYGDISVDEGKKPLFSVRRAVGFEDVDAISEGEQDVRARIERTEATHARLMEIDRAVAKLHERIASLQTYLAVDIQFSEICDSVKTAYTLGSIKRGALVGLEHARDAIEEIAYLEVADAGCAEAALFFACAPLEKENLLATIAEFGFTKCPFTDEKTAVDAIADAQSEIAELTKERVKLLAKMMRRLKFMEVLELYADYLSLEIAKLEASGALGFTKRTFLLEGWVPEPSLATFEDAVRAVSETAVVQMREPTEGEEPPTLLKNNRVVSNYEGITNMYAVPGVNEIDPNFVMSIFFFLFYGIMLGDAGYGLLLSIGTLTLVLTVRMERSMKNMMWVLFAGGISAIIWGLVFGSFFSIETFPMKGLLNPLEEPMLLLGLCLGLGVVQVLVGLGMKAANLIRAKKYLAALFDVGFLYILFIGIGLFAVGMLLTVTACHYAGIVMVAVGVIGMIATQGRAKPSVGGKLASGFGSLYGLINYLSDILSYSRLFCLGIVGGAIGMVVNKIAVVFIGLIPGFGYIPAIIMIVAFHGFNLALSVLSAYVHNMRLQFVEYYGKFYEGTGRLFAPLGVNTKYIVFDHPKKTRIKDGA